MPKVSVLIPSRNEQFLVKTVKDILAKSGDVEVIVTLEGYWDQGLPDDKRLILVHFGKSHGMRPAINAAAACARGQYLMKCDAHCMFDEGWDEKLLADYHEDNWVMVPRRYSLDAENWKRSRHRPPYDYHYLSWPYSKGTDKKDVGLHGWWWRERQEERKHILIDDEMSSQGSCWFMSRKHWDWMGGLKLEGYNDFIQEFQQVGMQTWLGGGAVKINKRTWYAHLHKGKRYGRGYIRGKKGWDEGRLYSADYWMNNRWAERVHDIDWLIEKFWPVPTWPEDWKEHDYSGLAAGQGH